VVGFGKSLEETSQENDEWVDQSNGLSLDRSGCEKFRCNFDAEKISF